MDVAGAAQLYREGLSLEKVAARVGVSRETVRRRLHEAGVPLRSPRPQEQAPRPHPDREHPQQWRKILTAALAGQEVIGVRVVVARHLGRTPTRAESNAARRAAHRLAAGGHATVIRVKPRGSGPGSANLLLARPGTTENRADLLGRVASGAPADQVERSEPPAIPTDLAAAVAALATAVQAIGVEDLSPVAARLLAASVDAAIEELRRVRSRLGAR